MRTHARDAETEVDAVVAPEVSDVGPQNVDAVRVGPCDEGNSSQAVVRDDEDAD